MRPGINVAPPRSITSLSAARETLVGSRDGHNAIAFDRDFAGPEFFFGALEYHGVRNNIPGMTFSS